MSKWRIDSRENALTNDWRKSSQQWEAKAKALQERVKELDKTNDQMGEFISNIGYSCEYEYFLKGYTNE